MSKDKPFGVNIVAKDWMPINDVAFIYDGIDNIVGLDGTNKEATYTVKEPKMVIVHAGRTRNLDKVRANSSVNPKASQS